MKSQCFMFGVAVMGEGAQGVSCWNNQLQVGWVKSNLCVDVPSV